MNLEDALTAALAQVATLTAQLAAEREAAAAEREAAAAERARLEARIDELLRKVDELLARKRPKDATPEPTPPGPTSPPQPPVQPPALAGRPMPPAKPPDEEEQKPRKRRTPKVRPGLPTVEEPPVRPDRCAHCGGTRLESKDVQEIALIDHVRGYVRRRIVRRLRCRCADCAKDTTPPAPPACLPRTHFTAAFVAFVLYCKLAMHLPWERTRADLAQQGYAIPSSTLNSVAQRALEMLAVVARVLWREVKSGHYAQSDATGLSVVTPGKKNVHHGQMFVFCWGKLVVFRYQPNKEGPTFRRMVEGFQGTLVLDASSTHNEALELPGVLWAGCNAHGLRKFRDAIEADPILAPEGERWVAAMFDKDREGREERGFSGKDLLAWRQAEVAPIAADFKRWIAAVHPTTLPKTPLREATTYYADYWRPMTRFLRDPNLPMDNNFSERSLRAEAVGRSNWVYAGSAQAAENLATGYTLVQTAKAEGVDVLDYLSWALERVRHCGDSLNLAEKLTPAAYKEAQKARDR